jgi:hypothetical protein
MGVLGMVDIDNVWGQTRYCIVSLPCAGVSRKVAKLGLRLGCSLITRIPSTDKAFPPSVLHFWTVIKGSELLKISAARR